MNQKITVIPQTINPMTKLPTEKLAKRRVAGYARVSTDSDEQQTSYEAQVDYYENYIKSKPEWEFIKVYTDEGISGTTTRLRPGFTEMINYALTGGIDLIITKSISRFARNTVDSLVTIRKLKDKGVECYFEKENIYTFDSKGELMITILSSLAQEESRSISESIKWSKRIQFSKGKIQLPYKNFLGFKKGEDDKPEIIEEEAKIIRFIYRQFLEGASVHAIMKMLEEMMILTPSGKSKWHKSTIDSILTNEKYKGDALLQKTFVVDFLEKKSKKNEGEIPQYYVENSHPAIIDPLEWELVQLEFARRKEIGKSYSTTSAFATKLICGDCGGYYGQKVWHSNSKYRRLIWQCNSKFKNNCKTPNLTEEVIKRKFLEAYNALMVNRDKAIEDARLMLEVASDVSCINKAIDKVTKELDNLKRKAKRLVNENATNAYLQEDYEARYKELSEDYDEKYEKFDELTKERELKLVNAKKIQIYIENLRNQKLIVEVWDEGLWNVMLKEVVVSIGGELEFTFNGGSVITL